jgi:hypothetical protein
MLDFDVLRRQNVARCKESFQPIDAWSSSDWAIAMMGEAGEACNALKKYKRLSDGIKQSNVMIQPTIQMRFGQ